MKYINKEGHAEIVEKKSRFLASVFAVASEEEALVKIAQIRKKYWDASHHCFAFVIGDRHEIQRCSDDKEPSGTAGKPILDVMMGQEIHNALIVVTRYFGGTLLGTGGLVRAYSKAAQEGILKSTLMEIKRGRVIGIKSDYNGYGKIQYLCGKHQVSILESEFTQEVFIQVLVQEQKAEEIKKEIREETDGRAEFCQESLVSYAEVGGEVRVL